MIVKDIRNPWSRGKPDHLGYPPIRAAKVMLVVQALLVTALDPVIVREAHFQYRTPFTIVLRALKLRLP